VKVHSSEDLQDAYVRKILDSAYAVSPALGKALERKFQEDDQAFRAAAAEAVPSQEPSFWARSGCKKCYGRGTLGTVYPSTAAVSGEVLKCACTTKRFQDWLKAFRKTYAAKPEEGERDEANQETAAGDSSEGVT